MSEAKPAQTSNAKSWPSLPYDAWQPTYDTLHMWMQIVGKVRMELMPPSNHWWHVPLYVTARGMTTSAIPCGDRVLQIDFDFVSHELLLATSDGQQRKIALEPKSVANFYAEFVRALRELGVSVNIWTTPVEVPDPIPFEEDHKHASYDREQVERFHRVLTSILPVFEEFRGEFLGKSSPVHFFWGSFDLALTRFSGRRAPARPGADPVTAEAYSHEEISVGWWPGGTGVTGVSLQEPVFYAYAAPEPQGFSSAPVRPAQAFYSKDFGEFLLRYEDARKAPDPGSALLEFLQSTYDAGANLGKWDRASLERMPSGKAA